MHARRKDTKCKNISLSVDSNYFKISADFTKEFKYCLHIRGCTNVG